MYNERIQNDHETRKSERCKTFTLILYLVNPVNFLNIRKVDLEQKKHITAKLEVSL